MRLTLLTLCLDLSHLGHPSESELDASGYDSPEDYWRDYFTLRLGQPAMQRAVIQIEEEG